VATSVLVDSTLGTSQICSDQVTFAPATSGSRRAKPRACGFESESGHPDRIFETQLTAQTPRTLQRFRTSSWTARTIFRRAIFVNDACILLESRRFMARSIRFEGQVTVFGMPRTMLPLPISRTASAGLCHRAPRAVCWACCGNRRLDQAMKPSSSFSHRRKSRRALLLFDALGMKFRELSCGKIPTCPMCGTHRTITKLIDYYEFCGVRGEEAPGPSVQVPEITPRELKSRLDHGDDIFILDVREPHNTRSAIKGHLIPLGELTRRVHELEFFAGNRGALASGKRSAEAVDFL